MYKLVKNFRTNEINTVNKQDGNMLLSIPFDPANTDYQEYLKWVAEGNVPLAAETNTPLPAENE
jgi:hypothetical protein